MGVPPATPWYVAVDCVAPSVQHLFLLFTINGGSPRLDMGEWTGSDARGRAGWGLNMQ